MLKYGWPKVTKPVITYNAKGITSTLKKKKKLHSGTHFGIFIFFEEKIVSMYGKC